MARAANDGRGLGGGSMQTLKQVVLLVLFSWAGIYFISQVDTILHSLLQAHDHVVLWLSHVFTQDSAGNVIQSILALVFIPFGIALVLNAAYWVVKRTMMPYTLELVWVMWVVTLVTLALQGG